MLKESPQVIPAEILEFDTWPSWRRLFGRPSASIRGRIAAWNHVGEALHYHADDPPRPPLPGIRGQGIFGVSQVYWQNLLSFETYGDRLAGCQFTQGRGVERSWLTNPQGALVGTVKVGDFRCDITAVEGISASKSSELHFDNVDEFGRYFNQLKRASIAQEGLDLMLRHREVRIIHEPGQESFSISMWDPRLFLGNAGGSHHFAGAAYIARAIGAPVDLVGPLYIHYFNVPAWRWLLDHYHLVQARTDSAQVPRSSMARLLGAIYTIKLSLGEASAILLLLPRAPTASKPMLDLLTNHGMASASEHVEWLLESQHEGAKAFEEKWPRLYAHLDHSVRERMGSAPICR